MRRRTIDYDRFHRVTGVDYEYDNPRYLSPFDAEIEAGDLGPLPLQTAARRIAREGFTYDWKGNVVFTSDDETLPFDRSLGTVSYGESIDKPNQLLSGRLDDTHTTAQYDEAGELIDLTLERPGHCAVGTEDLCAQRIVFDWDEVGQLARARRWDYAGTTIPAAEPQFPALPRPSPAWDARYGYSQGVRVLKSVTDAAGEELHTAEVFDSLRLEKARFDANSHSFQRSAETETALLGGIARVTDAPGLPSPSGRRQHVFFELSDQLGSAVAVVDAETSELVERVTYTARGVTESDFRPERWQAYRAAYRFSGKEDEVQFGITYFGARYFHPRLGRWLSPDPLWVHGLGADPDPYGYLSGRLFSAVDPWGWSDDIDEVIVRGKPRDRTPQENAQQRDRDDVLARIKDPIGWQVRQQLAPRPPAARPAASTIVARASRAGRFEPDESLLSIPNLDWATYYGSQIVGGYGWAMLGTIVPGAFSARSAAVLETTVISSPKLTTPPPLAHLTNNVSGAAITGSGQIIGRGGIYASTLDTAARTGVSYTARTGLAQAQATVGFRIPAASLGAFTRPIPIGLFTGWQRWAGTYYTAPGTINFLTGEFTASGAFGTTQATWYAVDTVINAVLLGSAGTAAYLYAEEESK